MFTSHAFNIYLYYQAIGPMSWVIANGLGDQGSIWGH